MKDKTLAFCEQHGKVMCDLVIGSHYYGSLLLHDVPGYVCPKCQVTLCFPHSPELANAIKEVRSTMYAHVNAWGQIRWMHSNYVIEPDEHDDIYWTYNWEVYGDQISHYTFEDAIKYVINR